jgi:hypothetical protein
MQVSLWRGWDRTARHPFFLDVPVTPARNCGRIRSAALAGTYEELVVAGRAGATAWRAVYVWSDPAGPLFTEGEREALWELFEAPVFALLRDAGGRLLAWECEAQAGFHRPEGMDNRPAVPGTLERAPCECGRPGIRIMLSTGRATDRDLPCVTL